MIDDIKKNGLIENEKKLKIFKLKFIFFNLPMSKY